MARSLQDRAKIAPNVSLRGLTTIKLDSQMQFIEEMPWQDAMTDLMNKKVNLLSSYMVEIGEGLVVEARARAGSDLNGVQHSFAVPFIVSLMEFVYDPYAAFLKSNSPVATKRAILTRDGYVCAYQHRLGKSDGCSYKADTVDHVMPQSRGGGNTWTNLVAACKRCNNKKADRTPSEAGMKLLWQPSKHDGGSQETQQEIWDYLMSQSGVRR